MDASKYLDVNLDVLNQLIMSLANFKDVFSDEHRAIILLNSLLSLIERLKMTLSMAVMISLWRHQ